MSVNFYWEFVSFTWFSSSQVSAVTHYVYTYLFTGSNVMHRTD